MMDVRDHDSRRDRVALPETIRRTCVGCTARTPWDRVETIDGRDVYRCALCRNHRIPVEEVRDRD